MLILEESDPRAVTLVTATRSGDIVALLRQLAEHPALANARIADGRGVFRTLLHVVADWPGHYPNGARTVAALLSAGAEANAPVAHREASGAPETALHWAASSDDVAVLDALLDGGADIEAPGAVFTGGTAMSDAVVFAQWRAARRLVERGAATTTWQAAALGLLDRVRACCAQECPEVRTITNALWHACRGGQLATAEYLVDSGADSNWIGYDGKTPCDVARESGNDALLEWLRRRGAAHGAGSP